MPSPWFRRKRQQQQRPEDPSEVTALRYLRVSSKRQDKGMSPEAQRHDIDGYIRLQGWSQGREYRDTERGGRVDRRDYQQMLTEVRDLRRQRRFVVVVAAALDRTGRDEAELHARRKEFTQLGAELHYVRDGGKLDDDAFTVKGLIARKETQKLSERVTASKKIAAERGLPPAGPASWGYAWRLPVDEREVQAGRLDPKSKVVRRILVANEAEAPFVRELFRRTAAGESLSALARWAAGLGAEARGGRSLARPKLLWVLQNPVYVARYVPDAETPADVLASPKGKWPALIEDETWAQVQERYAPKGRGRRPSGRYLLTGFLRCERCDCRMVAYGAEKYPRYVCISDLLGARRAEKPCRASVTMGKVDQAVRAKIAAVLQTVSDARVLAAAEQAWDALTQPGGTDLERVREVEARIKRLRTRLDRAREDLYDDRIEQSEYDRLTPAWRAALKAAEEEQRSLTAAQPSPTAGLSFAEALARFEGWGETLQSAPIAAQREVLRELVAQVKPVTIRKGKGGSYDAAIQWTDFGKIIADVAAALNATR